MNFRYTGDEIEYCLDLADVRMLVFGPEFIDRLNQVRANLKVDNYFFVGDQAQTPDYADNYAQMTYYCARRFHRSSCGTRMMRPFTSPPARRLPQGDPAPA